MEVSITQFRRELFDLVNRALAGTEVWVTHKGQRVKLVPDQPHRSKLQRLTSLQIIHPDASEQDELRMKQEMEAAWEKDWQEL